jgi:hypothetical protein
MNRTDTRAVANHLLSGAVGVDFSTFIKLRSKTWQAFPPLQSYLAMFVSAPDSALFG